MYVCLELVVLVDKYIHIDMCVYLYTKIQEKYKSKRSHLNQV